MIIFIVKPIRVNNYEMTLGGTLRLAGRKRTRNNEKGSLDIEQIIVHQKGFNLSDLNKDLNFI